MNQSTLYYRTETSLSCGINEVAITQACMCVCQCVWYMHIFVTGSISVCALGVRNGRMIIHSHETI